MGHENDGARERRRESRYPMEDRVFIQIIESDEQDLIGITLTCLVVDASAHGLRIASETFVPDGSRLDLWLDDTSRHGKFFLTSEVRWVTVASSGECDLGLEMLESPASDVNEWRQRHSG